MIDKEFVKINIFYKIKYSDWIKYYMILMMSSIVYMIYYLDCVKYNNAVTLNFFEYLIGIFLSETRTTILYPIIVVWVSYKIYKNDCFNNILIIKNKTRKSYFFNAVVSAVIVSIIIMFLSLIGIFFNSILLNMDYSLTLNNPVIDVLKLYCIKSSNLTQLLIVTIVGYIFYMTCISIMFFSICIIIKNNIYAIIVSILAITVNYEIVKFNILGILGKFILISKNIVDYEYKFEEFWQVKNMIYWISILCIILFVGYKIVLKNDFQIEKRIYDK